MATKILKSEYDPSEEAKVDSKSEEIKDGNSDQINQLDDDYHIFEQKEEEKEAKQKSGESGKNSGSQNRFDRPSNEQSLPLENENFNSKIENNDEIDSFVDQSEDNKSLDNSHPNTVKESTKKSHISNSIVQEDKSLNETIESEKIIENFSDDSIIEDKQKLDTSESPEEITKMPLHRDENTPTDFYGNEKDNRISERSEIEEIQSDLQAKHTEDHQQKMENLET